MKNEIRSNAPAYVQQLQAALIRRKEVERITALSCSRMYALMALGEFPRPIQLGPMSVAWVASEVHEWVAARIADSRQKGVAENRRARIIARCKPRCAAV